MGYACTTYTFSDSNDLQTIITTAAAEVMLSICPPTTRLPPTQKSSKNVCLPAGVPIIAGEEGICKGCGVATLSISYYDLGYKTGEMAYEILVNDADPATMEIEFAPAFTKMYNPEICSELGITLSDEYVAIEMD